MAEKRLLNLKQLINRNVQAVMPQEDQKENFKNSITEYITKFEGNEIKVKNFKKVFLEIFLKKLFQTNKLIPVIELI